MDNVIEFDSKVTEKDLLSFKFYHKYHTVSGIAEILLALILIVLAVMSAGKVNISYTLMVGVFGVFFLIFPENFSVYIGFNCKMLAERAVRNRSADS